MSDKAEELLRQIACNHDASWGRQMAREYFGFDKLKEPDFYDMFGYGHAAPEKDPRATVTVLFKDKREAIWFRHNMKPATPEMAEACVMRLRGSCAYDTLLVELGD
jgi:hypothetical protein